MPSSSVIKPRRYRTAARVLACAAALILCGCSEEDERNLLDEAETLVLDQQWADARAVLREQLLAEPDDAAAHFYLGRCHLMIEKDFRPVLAEGEFLLALKLFERDGKVSPIDRYTDEYFELMCYVDSAKSVMLNVRFLLEHDVPRRALLHHVDRGYAYLDFARGVNPDAEEIRVVNAMMASLGFRRGGSAKRSTTGQDK